MRSIWLCLIAISLPVQAWAQDLPNRTLPPIQNTPNLLPDPTRPIPVERPARLPESTPPPVSPAQFALTVEYRLVQSRRRGNEFALVDPNANALPEGSLASIDGGSHSGFRYGAGFRARGSPWEFAFNYTYFRLSDGLTVAAPAGGLIFPTQTRPGTVDTALTAAAIQTLRYNLYDLELGRNFLMDTSLGLRFVGGIRLAEIGQDFDVNYDGAAAVAAQAINRVNFRGAGLIVGGESHWTFRRGFSLFGRMRGGLMFGESQIRHRETNLAGALVNADVTDAYSQTVPLMEMGLGLAWRFRRWRTAIGYDAVNWFNLIDTPLFTDALSIGKIGHRTSNLALDGFFFNVSTMF